MLFVADPLNLAGVLTVGGQVPAIHSHRVAYFDGVSVVSLLGVRVEWLAEAEESLNASVAVNPVVLLEACYSVRYVRFDKTPANRRRVLFYPALECVDVLDSFTHCQIGAAMNLSRQHDVGSELQRDRIEQLHDHRVRIDDGIDQSNEFRFG